MEELCGNCKFGCIQGATLEIRIDERGHCFKKSPTVTSDGYTKWPQIYGYNWCGEWEKGEIE